MRRHVLSCNVFIRKSDVIVATSARTTHGFEIIAEPVFKVANDAPEGAIGTAVLEALRAYQVNVLPPSPDMSTKPSTLLRIAGYRNWGQLDKGSLNVVVEGDSDWLTLIPTQREPEGGVSHLNALAVKCRLTAEAIELALRKAGALCC